MWMGDGLDKTKLGFELPVSSSRPTREAVIAGRSIIGLPHFFSTNSLLARLGGQRRRMKPTYLGDQHPLVINSAYNLTSALWQADGMLADGEDEIYGGDGDDLIGRGKGSDRQYGGDGADTIFSEARMAAVLRVSPYDSYAVPVGRYACNRDAPLFPEEKRTSSGKAIRRPGALVFAKGATEKRWLCKNCRSEWWFGSTCPLSRGRKCSPLAM